MTRTHRRWRPPGLGLAVLAATVVDAGDVPISARAPPHVADSALARSSAVSRRREATTGPASCGSPCCGSAFTTAIATQRVVADLSAASDGRVNYGSVNCSASPPATDVEPFVEFRLGFAASFNCTVMVDTPEIYVGWHEVDVVVLPVPQSAATEIRIFAMSPQIEPWDDYGANLAISNHFRNLLDIPVYLKKRIQPYLGCDSNSDSMGGVTVKATDLLQSDGGSCGAACCLTLSTVQSNTTANVVERLSAALTANPNVTITTPFALVPDGDPGTYAGTATYQSVRAGQTDVLEVKWAVVGSDGNRVGNVTVRSFSLCTAGEGADRLCFVDDGLNARAQKEFFDVLNASDSGDVQLDVVYGCGVVPAPSIPVPTSAATGANVAGAVVAVGLVLITTVWIKKASIRNLQAAQFPSRLLYVIFMLMLVNTIGKSGWLPRDLPSGAKIFSLNYHPPIMSFAVLVVMTEGIWAAPSTHPANNNSRWRLAHKVLQAVAVSLLVVGLAAVVSDRQARQNNGEDVRHLTSTHSWIGVIMFTLAIGQFIMGAIAFWFGGSQQYAGLHRYFGYLTYFTAMLSIITGLSQFGHYLAIQDDGDCLDDSFQSATCFDRTFAILTCISWGISVVSLAPKLSESIRKSDIVPNSPT